MPTTTQNTTKSLAGRTLRWNFEGGPNSGTYEHTFDADGGVSFSKVDDGKAGKPTHVKDCGSFTVAPSVEVASYLSPESGYTLTVAMNFDTKKIYGFASNEKEWHSVSGTLEVVK